jgi:predicted RNA binding protein YcfA (HicA-like mRNA interferase family)
LKWSYHHEQNFPMRPLTAKKLIHVLVSYGFVLVRHRGSHQIYRRELNGIIVPVPLHGKNRPIPVGTFLEIVKQSKLPKDVFK